LRAVAVLKQHCGSASNYIGTEHLLLGVLDAGVPPPRS
jgi:hypothetical protein